MPAHTRNVHCPFLVIFVAGAVTGAATTAAIVTQALPEAARAATVPLVVRARTATAAAETTRAPAARAPQSECQTKSSWAPGLLGKLNYCMFVLCSHLAHLLILRAATTKPPRVHLAALRVPGTAAPTDTAQAAAAALMGHALTVQQTAAVASTGRVAQASALVPVPAAVRVVLAHIATAAAASAPGHAVRAQQSECQAEVLLHGLVRLENTTTARLHMPSSHGLSSQHLFSFPRHCMQQLQDHHEYI